MTAISAYRQVGRREKNSKIAGEIGGRLGKRPEDGWLLGMRFVSGAMVAGLGLIAERWPAGTDGRWGGGAVAASRCLLSQPHRCESVGLGVEGAPPDDSAVTDLGQYPVHLVNHGCGA